MELTKQDIHDYIKNNGPRSYVITDNTGKESVRRLFISTEDRVCEFAKRSRKRGYALTDEDLATWVGMSLYMDKNAGKSSKYIKLAKKATFDSDFVRRCLAADPELEPYANHLTTGCGVDNEVITLKAIEKWSEYHAHMFRKALAERKPYQSGTFDFRGYDGSLWIEVVDKPYGNNKVGDIRAGFSKEYRGCGNGYYYALVNDDTFIGVDVD